MTTTAEWRKWNAVRTKAITNYDLLIRKTPEEMASFIQQVEVDATCAGDRSYRAILDWLKQEAVP